MMAAEATLPDNFDGRNGGEIEPKKKLKKRRSIRVSRVPSLKPSSRRSKSRFTWAPTDLSSDASSLQLHTEIALSDSSSNCVKPNCSFYAKKEDSQGGSEWDDNSVISSSCGSTDRAVHPFIVMSDDWGMPRLQSSKGVSDASPSYLKEARSSEGRRAYYQASPSGSDSGDDSSDQSKSSHTSQSNSVYSRQKSLHTSSRASSVRNMRFLIKKNSFKPKRPSLKSTQMSEEWKVDKATFSSIIKDSRFPDHKELEPGVAETDRSSFLKVCRYHHCSLNGHCHEMPPPEKHFPFLRRKSLKPLLNIKANGVSNPRRKPSAERKKGSNKHTLSSNLEPSVQKGPLLENDKSEGKHISSTKARVQQFRGAKTNIRDPNPTQIGLKGSQYPEKDERDSLNQVRNSFAGEDASEPTFELKETRFGCHSRKSEVDESISMALGVELEGHEIAATSVDDFENNPTFGGGNYIFPQTDSSELLKTLSNPSGRRSENDANFKKKTSENIPSNKVRNLSSSDFAQATKDSSVISSASNSQTLQGVTVNTEERNNNPRPGRVLVAEFTPDEHRGPRFENEMRISEPAPLLEVQKPMVIKGKNISMWHLIHKHMASDLVAIDAAKPLQGADEKKQVEKSDADTAKECSDVSLQLPISDVGIDNHEKADEEIEIRKLFAIKLVREAIEKILLPELQDQSSKNQSITSDIVEDQELSEKNHQGGPAEGCYSVSNNNVGVGNAPADQREFSQADESISKEEKNSETKSGKKSGKKSPNNWSNLKKWVLLQRFIKELEKVCKFNPNDSQHEQLENDPEAEKVNLRHQTVDERKRSEEWMLDYALRQVVSQLAPTQKRKVALLVKAFETVVPPQEDSNFQVSMPKLKDKHDEDVHIKNQVDLSASEMEGTKSQAEKNVTFQCDDQERSSFCEEHSETNGLHQPAADCIQSATPPCMKSDTTMYYCKEVTGNEESQQEISIQNVSNMNTENLWSDFPCTSQSATFGVGVKATETQEVLSATDEITVENKNASEEEENGRRKSELEHIHLQDMQQDTNLRPNSEFYSGNTVSSKSIELDDVDGKADEPLNKSQSVLVDNIPGTMENAAYPTLAPQASTWKETIEEPKPEAVVIRELPPKDFNYQYIEKEAGQSQLEKQNYMRMWHMVYQHVASSIATKVGIQLLGGDGEEVEDANKSSERETFGPWVEHLECNHDGGKENPEANQQQSELSRSEAVKLVQEAVDEILVPKILDDTSDTQSVTSEIILDLDLSEKEQSDIGEQSILSSTRNNEHTREFDGSKGQFSLDEEEKGSKNDIINTEDHKKQKSPEKKESDAPKLKNWSRLKKLMVLKRSIKAMENARKLKSQPKQPFPLPCDPEPEKIDLRHQMMNERRKAEQWMLDYAVQHIVTKLTPARKRKVAMLVEAFEAVVPLPQI